jgi:endoglucanase
MNHSFQLPLLGRVVQRSWLLLLVILFTVNYSVWAQCTGSTGNWLSASGTKLVDSNNKTVRLTGVNWFGFETSNKFPHGLWSRDCKSMLTQIKDLGFNCIRLPYSNAILAPGATLSGINSSPTADPYTGRQLNVVEGKITNPLLLMDLIVDYCQELNLKIILDNHSREPDGYISEELWYTASVSNDKWISDWVFLANRYKTKDAVIAMDLDNEPHGKVGSGAKWGTGLAANDWRLAAQQCGNAILEVNPNVLIMVEGVEEYNGATYWWGGNLQGAATYPVVLSNPAKLVYSPHEYGPTVYPQPWFNDPTFPSNMPAIWEKNFNFLLTQNKAPLFAGEFGLKTQGGKDEVWFDAFLAFMGQKGYSWTFWCWNPNSGDTGGILADDWTSVNQWKVDKLKPHLSPIIPNGGCVNNTTFTISASAGTGGSISPSGNVSVNKGSNQTFTITPAAGYAVNSVTVDGTSVGAVATYTFTNVQANRTISATFKTVATTTFTITSSAGANGTISPAGSVSVTKGANQTFTISPAAGYTVNSVTVDGTSVGAVTTYTFTNVQANRTINATFKTVATTSFTITSSASAGGSISPAGSVSVAKGANQTFTITPSSGYQVDLVTVNGASVGAVTTYTFANVQANQTIAAKFKVAISSNCKFGTPRATALASIPYATFSKAYVLGTGGPNLSNVTSFVINWDLPNNGLWQLSFNTNNGVPNWYLDLRAGATYTLNQAQPKITFTNSGIAGLSGQYYANSVGSDFVLVSVAGSHTIYFSNSATAPTCTAAARVEKDVEMEEASLASSSVYPNPFQNQITVFVKQPEQVDDIVVMNSIGGVVHRVEKEFIRSENNIELNESGAGFYIVRVSKGKSNQCIKVIKQ